LWNSQKNQAFFKDSGTIGTMKIKAINSQTGSFFEKVLQAETGIFGECLIGRDPRCGLVLNRPEVSPVHGRILFQQGRYWYTDLGSTEGSRVNNHQVQVNQGYILKPGDIIRIGSFVLLIEDEKSNSDRLLNQQTDEWVAQLKSTEGSWWTGGEITVRCVQVIAQTDDVKTFRFVACFPVLFRYKPGQFVTVSVEIDGRRVERAYSISSSPSRPHTLDITVKRVPPPASAPDAPPGLVSNWLHDNITVGSKLKISSPMGNLTCLPDPSTKLLLISAGSGITRMMSIARWICDTVAQSDVAFVHSACSPRHIIFRQELELMATQHPNFQLHVTTTQKEPGSAWLGYSGRLNKSMLKLMVPDCCDRIVYVCGSDLFMQGVKAILESLNFPMHNYYEESIELHPKQQKTQKGSAITRTNGHSKAPILVAPPLHYGGASLLGNRAIV
jgi:glycine betaine catabolism B